MDYPGVKCNYKMLYIVYETTIKDKDFHSLIYFKLDCDATANQR